MVEAADGENYIGVDRPRLIERQAKLPNAGTSIKDDQMIPATHFDTRCVAAEAQGLRVCGWNSPAHTPKAEIEFTTTCACAGARVFYHFALITPSPRKRIQSS